MLKKNIVIVCSCLLVCFFVQPAVRAQRVADVVSRKLGEWNEQNLQEKLFVHTDKSFYMAGEILWFKIYATDAVLLRPLDFSKVSYVELLNQDHKPVMQAKIAMNNTTGNGSFQLSYSINSGNYILRAYTNWMKNAGPDLFFEKNITVVNALKRPDWPVVTGNNYDVQFFPEGGNLVGSISSRVGYKVVDKQGKGQDASGVVINQRNDTVARFSTQRFGMGSFVFKPYEGDSYRAIVMVNGTSVSKPMPAAYAKGMVMRVKDGANQLSVHVESNTGESPVAIILQAHNSLTRTFTLDVVNGEADLQIDKKDLAAGVSQLTLFNAAGKPVCERVFFKRPSALALQVETDAAQYTTRKKVDLSILAKDAQAQPVGSNLSASVYLLDSLQTPDNTDILSYLWLQSDLKGNIESPAYYFRNDDPEADVAADNLMLTQGWRRFNWETILAGNNKRPEFIPETEGHIIQGKLVDKRNGQPVQDITTYLSVPREKSLFNTATSGVNGNLRYDVKNFYGGNEIVVQPANIADSFYRVDIATPFFEKYSDKAPPPFNLPEKNGSLVLAHSIQAQVNNTYNSERTRRYLFPQAIDTTPFYGLSDKRYYLDDYTRFITMEEVMREYIAEVKVRRNGNQFSFHVFNKPFEEFFETSPLVLMDGVPVTNVNKMIDFDPLKIRRIDIVAQKFYQNNLVHDGIIQYHSYLGDLAGYQLDASALIIEYEGLQLQREFYAPVYDNTAQMQSRLPDPRNLLLWSPDIRTDANGSKKISFYTADTPGKYLVMVQGISEGGLAGSKTMVFTVNP